MSNSVVLETCILNMSKTDTQPEFKSTCMCKKVGQRDEKYSTHHKLQIQLDRDYN